MEILKNFLNNNKETFTDITLYSIVHFLSVHTQDSEYLQQFVEIPNLDERWLRIVYIDITRLRNTGYFSEKLL